MDKPKCWVKNDFNFHFLTLYFLIAFLTQYLSLSIFDPNLAWKNPTFF